MVAAMYLRIKLMEKKINDLIQIMNTPDEDLSDPEKKHKKQVINKLGVHLYQCTKAQKIKNEH